MPKILIVDDDALIQKLLSKTLSNIGYDILTASCAEEAINLVQKHQPNLIFMDIDLPNINGLEAVYRIRQLPEGKKAIILVLTLHHDEYYQTETKKVGANYFLKKPFRPRELVRKVKEILNQEKLPSSGDIREEELEKYYQTLEELQNQQKKEIPPKQNDFHEKVKNLNHQQLIEYAEDLNSALLELYQANAEIQEAYKETISRLVLVAEYKDSNTGQHIRRISLYSKIIAQKLGLPQKQVDTIELASPMHDIGKVAIPDAILQKPTKLTPEEFEIMKKHTIIGANILKNSRSNVLKMAEAIALTHHEQWNGNGYPQGLKGEEIPLEGRIVALADVFDALTSQRPYKPPYPTDTVLAILQDSAGEHFDPKVVQAFFQGLDEILKIQNTYNLPSTENLQVSPSERDQNNQLILQSLKSQGTTN